SQWSQLPTGEIAPFRLTSRGCRPFFAEKEPLALSPGAPNPLMIFLPATSMVMAPHWGDHSLSVDLRIDEIPSTGGHRFFAHWRSSEVRPGALRIACFGKETHTHRGRDPRPAHRARQDSTSFSPLANDPLGHHSDRSPLHCVPVEMTPKRDSLRSG
ncbi:hypothetical protein SAMN06297397_1637, partial [Aristaeella lactis]